MIRISFHRSMLAGFLLIVVFLGWAGVRGWFLLEQFARKGRVNSELALQLGTSVQEVGARSVDIERSARQYLVLSDAAVLGRFDAHLARSQSVVDRLNALPDRPLGTLPDDWRRTAADMSDRLRAAAPPAELNALLKRLAQINAEMEIRSRDWIEACNAAMLDELEQGRLRLGALVAATIAGAFLVALGMSWWLARPIRTIEQAIEQLGENRLDQPVEVQGPPDLRQVGKRLDWLRQRLAELEAERERTLRHVSHELKTPLTALREGVALLQDGIAGPLEDAQREVVDILDANTRSLQGHIESLLRLNAVSLGSRRQHCRPVNVRRLIGTVVQERELQIQSRKLKIQSAAPSLSGMLDADKLRVILDNLLSNAIDFSPDGGIVRLEAHVDGNRLRVACIDQGPGVAVEDAERIFAPFVQGQRPAPVARQGSGVGLSIVRELATVMGGAVRVIAPGNTRGAYFEIDLPWTAVT